MTRIAFLGLGAMGARMAQRLVAAGHEVAVWNRSDVTTRAPGLADRAAPTPRGAADGAEVVITMVTDDAASEAVWEQAQSGALAALAPGALAIESSTLTPARASALADRVRARGAAFLDAPVVGTRPAAEAGTLVYLVGGEAKVVERARPVLAAMGSAIHHVGPTPAGATLKLIVNTLFAVQVATVAELLGLARRSELDLATVSEVLGGLPTTSPAAKGAMAAMLAGRFEPLFPVALVAKDLGYAGAQAAACGAALPLTGATEAVYRDAMARGLGDLNLTALIRLYNEQVAS